MKYVVCIPDGCADLPLPELDNKTPLEVANTPVLDELAARGKLGRAKVIPEGKPPGSDVGTMSIFGCDPKEFHTGRSPIEAAAMGIDLGPYQVAFRCNLTKVDFETETMLDFAGGHPDNETAAKAIDALNDEFGGSVGRGMEIQFHPGVQYRHIAVVSGTDYVLTGNNYSSSEIDERSEKGVRALSAMICTPPHDISGQKLHWPKQWAKEFCRSSANRALKGVMEKSREVLAGVDGLEANQIWLWGQGTKPKLPDFFEKHGKKAGLVSAVDLVRGLGTLMGMDIVDVPGATAWYDTDYRAKRDAVLAGLENGADLFILHVEASDEAGHEGNTKEKIKCLENWDSKILKGLIKGLDSMGDWRLLFMPDHATPLALKTHTSDPVPYLLVDSKGSFKPVSRGGAGKNSNGSAPVFTEACVKRKKAVDAHLLMSELLAD